MKLDYVIGIDLLPCPSVDCDADPDMEDEAPCYEHVDNPQRMRLVCPCGVAGPWADTFDAADLAWNKMPRRGRWM